MRIVRQSLLIAAALFATGGVWADTTYEWKTTTTVWKPGDSSSPVSGVTAYLIDAEQLKQQKVLTDVLGGNQSLAAYVEGVGDAKLSEATVYEGAVSEPTFTRPSDVHAYFVLQMDYQVDGNTLKALYFSGYSSATAAESGTATLVLNATSSSHSVYSTMTFQGSMEDGAGGGWYIPEPSSGVLLLLGLAGLALRRRKI